jgi:hypothetical protein
MKKLIQQLLLTGLAFALAGSSAVAVPYASGIVKDGNTIHYVLNQNAASVQVVFDDASTLTMGTTPGSYNFDMTGHTTYEIKVTGNDAPVWTQYVPDQLSTAFYVPYGLAVNKLPNTTNFGKVYVSEALGGTTGGRTTADGIYVLQADGTDAGWFTGGQSWSGGSNPYKSTIGPDGHLYVADLSDDLAFEFNDDMSVATQLIDSGNRTTGQYVRSICVQGTKASGNRKIYLVDNHSTSTRKGLIGYDLGTSDTAIGLGTGTQIIGPTYFGASYYPYDAALDSSGNWYMNTYRANLNERPAITKFNGAGTLPLDDDVLWGTDPAVYYYSFCIDVNEMDRLAAYGTDRSGDCKVYLFNLDTGAFVQSFVAGSVAEGTVIREVAFDAAGNLVTADNNAERVRFWSPGGYTVASTRSDGTQTSFQVVRPAAQVSVTASSTTVPEAGPAVNFTISRAVATASDLAVNYTLSGTATNGVEYTPLSGTATIPANSTSVDVTLSPLEDTIAELSETVILTLAASSNYSVVIPASATVSILDNEAPEVSFASAAPKKLLESYASSKVTHQLVRRGLLTSALTVNISYTGSATRGADFNAPATVTIGAGAATANLVLTPINDQAYEGNEIATADIAAGTGYGIGTAASISATVIDDDPPPGTVLFSDDFQTDSSALWQVNMADPADCLVDFAWDYSTVGIPVAPGTTDGSTKGMRMRCGNTILQIDGLSLSPLDKHFTGDYRLKFDMWINYNGPMPDGGAGSTQNLDAGVGTVGNIVVWLNNPSADGVWFSATGDGADGYTGGDYNALIGQNIQNDDTGFYAAGTGAPNSGIRDNWHAYYSMWGGQAAPAAQLALYPNQTGVAYSGNAGMAWHTVVITKTNDVVTWVIDGMPVATVTNTSLPFGDNVFVGYQDLFASGNLSDVPAMSFGLVDNLRVESLTAPITATTISTGSGYWDSASSTLRYTGGSGTRFILLQSASLSAPLATWTRVATNTTTPGMFTIGGPPLDPTGTKYYRVMTE